ITWRTQIRTAHRPVVTTVSSRTQRWDFAAQTGVIEVAMRVYQPRQQRLLAKIDNFAGVARSDLGKLADIGNLISGNSDCAVLDGRGVHRHDSARANDHSPFTTFRHSAINRLHAS